MEEKQIIRHFDQTETWQQRVIFCLIVLGRSAGYLLLYFCVPALFLSVGYVLFHGEMDGAEFFTYGGSFYTTLGMAASLLFLYRRAKKRKVALVTGLPEQLDKIAVEKGAMALVFGITTALALSAGLTLLGKIPALSWLMGGYTTASQSMYRGYDLVFCILSTVLLAPLVEEVIFRGYVLDIMLASFRERTALMIVTVGFALCHINGLWVVYAAGMGFLLSYLAIREDGIFYPVLCHIGFNLPSAVTVAAGGLLGGGESGVASTAFLLALGIPCGGIAYLLARHYAQQSESGYRSIFSNWRYQP